jgi:hypothetical protein
MLASFQPARCNSEVFLDSLSNDLILRGHSNTQHLLIGFGSNVDSTINISKSNLSIVKGAVYASNIGIGTTTPANNMRLHVSGDTRIEGNLIVNGTVTNINTDVRVTDQFSICNDGTGPALVVTQLGAQPVVEFRDDDKVVFKVADGGFITIGSNEAQTKLDVEGHTTVRGTIYTSNVITSNVQTSSLTSTLTTNLTTITSNLYSSNLIINNQVIINSNGVITNSNYLPPFNTSNVVAGQFTSNFIKDDNITSAKLTSNLVLKGTTTMSSNVFINNGDLKILGSNNFINVGDQARLFLGSNDYFMASSKGVGMVFQVPGTTYPVIIENVSGNLGLGTMDPQENLHVKSNAKIDGSTYVMTRLAVGNSNPTKIVDITGTTQISDTVTLLDDISIMSNNGAWSTQAGRQLYMKYSTNGGQDATYIQSIERSTETLYDLAIEAKNIAIGRVGALTNPTIYAQQGGRVGIGTSNPRFALHTVSNISDGVVVAVENTNSTTPGWAGFATRNSSSAINGGMRMGILGTAWNNNGIYLQNGGFIDCDHSNGISIASTSNSGEIRLYTGGTTERARMTSNGLLGIGTSVPTETLQIVGKTYTDTQFLGNSNDNASIPSFSFKEDSNTGIFHPSNDAIGFTTAGGEKMRIDNIGNVGIGLTDAQHMLDVVGNIHTSNNSAFIAGNRTGFIRIIASECNTYIQSGLSNSTNSAAPLIFTTINNATEWARFNSNGLLGLGTTTPAFKLDVSGQANITSSVVNKPSFTISNNLSPYMQLLGSNTTFTIGSSGSNTFHSTDAITGDVVIKNEQTLATGKILLQVGNGASAITVNSNNFVGVGTSTPTNTLDVAGRLRATSNIYADAKISFCNNLSLSTPTTGIEGGNGDRLVLYRGGTGVYPFSVGINSSTLYNSIPNNAQYLWYHNGTSWMSLSNGLLGVGTSNQTEKIEVIGGKLYSDTQILSSSNDNQSLPSFSFKEDSNTGIFHPSNDTLGFTTAGTEKVRINHLGNVGIGTSTQSYKLDVFGDLNITHSNASTASFTISNNLSPYAVITGSNSMLIMGVSGSNQTHSLDAVIGDVVIKNQQVLSSGKLHLQVGSVNSAITINSNNTVGIGTVNPTAPLMVSAMNTNSPDTNGIYVYNSNNTASSHAIISARVAGTSAGNAYTSYDVSNAGGWSVGLDNSDSDKFKIVNTWNFTSNPRLTIDNTGLVGINTTTPSQTLDVNGATLLRNGNNATSWFNNQLLFGFGGQSNFRHAITTRHDNAGGIRNSIDFLLWNSNVTTTAVGTTNTMSITATGVGINTSNPNSSLDVIGNARVTNTTALDSNLRFNDSNSGQRIALWHSDTNAQYHGIGVSNSIIQVGIPTSGHSIMFGLHSNSSFTPLMDIEGAGNVGIGTITPSAKLHINGDVLANSNIRSSVGTLGPSFTLVPENSYIDVSPGNQVILNSLGEAGNPATGATRPLFYGSSFLYQDASGEDMKWNFGRLIFRGCPLNVNASTSVFTVQDFISSRTPQYSNLTNNFTLSNDGQNNGYVTYATPWFGVSTSSGRSLALNLVSNNLVSSFRVGQVQIQFRT